MKHLFYGILYTLTLAWSDSDSGYFIIFLCSILTFVFIRLFLSKPPVSSTVDCIVTTPTGTLSLVDDTSSNSTTINGTGTSTPRRQRSLRERAGIDGKLDKLHNVVPNSTAYLAPSPVVSSSVNAEFTRPVRKTDFVEHVRFMSQDSDCRFMDEYKDLNQVGRGQPCAVADSPCNRGKNRFANILPYDHSRVKLRLVDGVEGSDYINASYIPGYNGLREFICTQGPLSSTRNDFWRMVWEQNSRDIVNLTRCLEKGREKCDQYWPREGDSVQYENIRVSTLHEDKLPFGAIREFKVSRADEQCRTVSQFHFTAWPDFGVPERPQTLVRFVRAFRAHVWSLPKLSDTNQSPVIVHCSAGVGRSGTMVAVDRILQHLRHHDHIDVYGVVYEMRKERYWMVQTEQQYIFIHHCLLCVLEEREDTDDVPQTILNSNPTSPLIHFSNQSPFP